MADQESAPASESTQIEAENGFNGNESSLHPPESENIPAKSMTPSNARTCGVCMKMPAKYKCTRCELPYCSIACNVEHKASHPPLPEPQAPEIKTPIMDASSTPTNGSKPIPRLVTRPGAGPSYVFSSLGASPELQRLFAAYPSLRGQLREIYQASQPPIDDFYEPNDRPGRYTAGRDTAFWTKEQGTRDGVEALQAAKKKFGQDGEGVREFASLVVNLVSPENAVNGSLDGPTVVQREAQEDTARMITQLLNGELGNA